MDGAEKALTEIAEPLARLFERATGVAMEPALAAAILAMCLVLIGILTALSLGALARTLWRKPRSARVMATAGEATSRARATLASNRSSPAVVVPASVATLNDNAPATVPVPAAPRSTRPRPAARVKQKRPAPRVLAARKLRDAVLAHRGEPEWQANPENPSRSMLQCRSIDGLPMRIELTAPQGEKPLLHLLNIWCDGAKVLNYEWLPGEAKAEKLRFLKAGDWIEDVGAWRFIPTVGRSAPPRDIASG